jgi:hypothetical protein
VIRTVQFSLALLGLMLLGIAGCSGPTGPSTVPAKGTLTIDGQPADNVTITLSPVGAGEPASGQVKNGAFQLSTGTSGKPGAVPGKYKVVLAQASATSMEDAKAMYTGGKGGKGGPPKQTLSFPEKYKAAGTSDKEVEIKSGSNDLKIDITK